MIFPMMMPAAAAEAATVSVSSVVRIRLLIRACGDAENQAKDRYGSIFHAEDNVTNGSVKRLANMADERLQHARWKDFTICAHGISFCSSVRGIRGPVQHESREHPLPDLRSEAFGHETHHHIDGPTLKDKGLELRVLQRGQNAFGELLSLDRHDDQVGFSAALTAMSSPTAANAPRIGAFVW
jgi:hypothetical protein